MRFISLNDLYYLTVIIFLQTFLAAPSHAFKMFIADSIGTLAYYGSRQKRKQSEANIRRTLVPAPTPAQARRIVLAGFREFWRDQCAWRLATAERAIPVEGWEHLHAARAVGKGAILLESSFFASRNLAKQILNAHGIHICQLHSVSHLGGFQAGEATWMQRNIIRPFFEKLEKQFVAEIIHVPDTESVSYTRQLLSRLQSNAVLCISADGNAGHKKIPTPFLGHTELFPTGMMSLGKISGAPLLPIFCVRLPSGKSRLIVEHPLAFDSQLGRDQALAKVLADYTRLLEVYIQKYPGQYRHWHYIPSNETS